MDSIHLSLSPLEVLAFERIQHRFRLDASVESSCSLLSFCLLRFLLLAHDQLDPCYSIRFILSLAESEEGEESVCVHKEKKESVQRPQKKEREAKSEKGRE